MMRTLAQVLNRLVLLSVFTILPAAAAGCGGDDGDTTTTTPPPGACEGLAVAPGTAKIGVGKTQSFSATCTTGTATGVAWSSSDSAIATVDAATGTATAVAKGTATITATLGTATAIATLEVADVGIVSIAVTPGSATIAVAGTQAFTATATLGDGTTSDVTATATWASSDTATATIDATGKATGVKAGTTNITAAVGAVTSSAAVLTVGDKKVSTIDVSCTPAKVAAGAAAACKATINYDDKTSEDGTSKLTWASADATIATVSDDAATKGAAKGIKVGKTKISATDAAGNKGEFELEVSAADLTSVTINPGAAIGNKGGADVKFTAQANFADGTFSDVTATATWKSSDATKATVDATGSAKPLDVGTVTITADFGGKTGSATLAISPAVATKLEITPSTAVTAKGTTLAFTATATNSDGSVTNVTSSASWTSADATVATVSVAGLAKGEKKGTVKITATFSGLTATADLEVTDATVTALTISPAGPLSLPIGLKQKFVATATLSDGTDTDVSATASFTSSAAGTLTFVANEATGAKLGDTNVSATFGGKTSNVVAVKVTDAAIVSIDVTPATPADLPIGATQPFKATATLSAGAPIDITTTATWASTVATTASIASGATGGIALGLAGGTTIITASQGGVKSANVTLKVKPASVTLVSIAVTPGTGTVINKGATAAFKATGSYSDSSSADITNSPISAWDVVDFANAAVLPAIATVSNPGAGGPAGVATGNGSTAGLPVSGTPPTGKAFVRARQGTVSGRAELTVKETKVNSIVVTCTNSLGAGGNALLCVPAGISYPFLCSAVGTFADGTTASITADAAWSSSVPATAVFSKLLGSNAVFTAVGNGRSVLVATYKNPDGTSVASWVTGAPNPVPATVSVGTRTLTDTILGGPTANTMNLGAKFNYTLTGVYSAATGCPDVPAAVAGNRDVTPLATYTSTFPAIASISNAEGSVGQASALAKGNTSIGAAYLGINKTLALTVADRCVASLELLPKNPTVPARTYTKLTINATYSDGKVEALNYGTAPGNAIRFGGGESGCDSRIGCSYPVPNTAYVNTYEVMNGAAAGVSTYTARIAGLQACGGGTVTSLPTTFTRVTGIAPNSITVTPLTATVPRGGAFASFVQANFTTATGAADHNVSYVGGGPNGNNGNGSSFAFDPDLNFSATYLWTNNVGADCLSGVVNCGGGNMSITWRQNSPFPAGITTVSYGLGARSVLQTITVSGKAVSTVTLAGWKSGTFSVGAGTGIPVGIKPRMRVNVAYTDGTTDNEDTLAGSISFESSDPSKIGFASATSNVGDALAAGTTAITATVGGVKSAPLTYTVNTAKLCQINAIAAGAPANNTMVKNSTKTVTVLGRYRDTCAPVGTFRGDLDIADAVTSNSGDSSIVSVTTDASGTTAKTFGTAAAAPGINLNFSKDGVVGGLQNGGFGSAVVGMVVQNLDGCINAVTITSPASSLSLPRGAPIEVAISCSFTGSPVPCAASSFTSTVGGFFATLPGDAGFGATGRGTVATGATGSTNITAVVNTNTCAGAIASPIRTITRSAATLSGISLTPASATVPKGGTQQYRVDANYSDGSSFDVSKAIGTGGANRLFTAAFGVIGSFQNGAKAVGSTTTEGSATLNADYTDGTTPRSSTFVTLNVSGVTRTGLQVTAATNQLTGAACPTAACYPEGNMALQLFAKEQMSDLSIGADLSSTVTWSLEAPVASGAAIDATGLFTTPADVTGNVVQTVKATDGTFSKTFAITIIDGAVTGIKLVLDPATTTVKSVDALPKGLTRQYDANVTVGGKEYRASRNVTWASSTPASVSVVASGATAGNATAVDLGTSNITATRGTGTSGVLAITVGLSTPASIVCAPTTGSVALGNTIQLRIIATNTDASTTDVTDSTGPANFIQSGTGNLTGGAKGLYTAAAAGTRVVTANFGGAFPGLPATAGGSKVCTITITP